MAKLEKVNFREKRVCLVDRGGMFVSWADRLSKEFGEVYYHNLSWKSLSPKSNELLVGHGFENFTMLKDFWNSYSKMDLFIFPFIFDGDMQEELQRQGKRVWGGRRGDEIELYRAEAKQEMKKLGMPVGDYSLITGMTALRKYLQKHRNVHVKINLTRGDSETFRSPSYDEILPRLRQMEYELDQASESILFIVESPIEPAVELGFDGWYCGGFPDYAINGVEIKDLAYAGAFLPYRDLDDHITNINQWISPLLDQYGYRGFMSTEIRVGPDEKPYLIDFTARSASPAGESMQEQITNWAPIMWYGAEGVLVNPESEFKYSAQAVIQADHADEGWQSVRINDDFRRWVKLFFHCRINDMDYVAPQNARFNEVGWCVGLGDTLKEAISKCIEHADHISGYKMTVKTDALQTAVEEIEKAQKLGIMFSDELIQA